jgi:hypothetical protein
MKRDILLSKLERVIETVEKNGNLPLSIKELHIFGSFLLGKENPDDLDLFLIHEEPFEEKLDLYLRGILNQRMNGILKGNREGIDIIYNLSLDAAIKHMKVRPSLVVKIWSKDDHEWKDKLSKALSMTPSEKIPILWKEIENLREYIRKLEKPEKVA